MGVCVYKGQFFCLFERESTHVHLLEVGEGGGVEGDRERGS